MAIEELLAAWRAEEQIAHIHGWDFSHVDGRVVEDPLPWDYRQEILCRLKPEMRILDIDTGGGEFLLSLGHPPKQTAATENYPPNVALCQRTLLPLGVDFRQADGKGVLPFPDGYFDMVINRHGDRNEQQIYRVLKPGGLFITQQVGAENDRQLVQLLCGDVPAPFPEQYLRFIAKRLEKAGFELLDGRECFVPVRFYDVGALVWFARIIQWEFPGFSVERYRQQLMAAQGLLEEKGCIEGSIHRILTVARK